LGPEILLLPGPGKPQMALLVILARTWGEALPRALTFDARS